MDRKHMIIVGAGVIAIISVLAIYMTRNRQSLSKSKDLRIEKLQQNSSKIEHKNNLNISILDSDNESNLSALRTSYDRLKQKLIGPPQHSSIQSYETLYPHPTSIFPYGNTSNKSSDGIKEQIQEIRNKLLKKNILLQSIANEMDLTNIGDGSRIAYLMSNITEASTIVKYVFVGTKSVGKSQILNAITSLSLSAMAVETKSPIFVNMRTVSKGKERFAINGGEKKFEDFLPELRRMFESQTAINDKEIRLEIHAPFIAYPMDFVDLPGYASTTSMQTEAKLVIEMIKTYAKDPNVVFVLVSDATRDPTAEEDNVSNTLREIVDDSRIIFIINKVNLLMTQRNSTRQFVARIKNIVDNLKCSEENLPYLFTVPNDERLDAKSASFQKISSEKQVEFWENLIEEGEKLIASLNETYGTHWESEFRNGYPMNRLGIKAWKENQAATLFDRFRDTIITFVEEEERQTPATDGLDKLEVPQWHRIMDDFSVEFVKFFERVSKNQGGIWHNINDTGGKEFLENEQLRKQRTDTCVDYLMSQRGSLMSQNTGEQSIYGRILNNPLGYLRRESERGSALLQAEVYDLYNWMIASFVNLSDSEIDLAIPKESRHSTICDSQVTPFVISRITQKIFTEYSVRQQVSRLQCTVLRIARSALWLLLQEHNKFSDYIYILAMQPKFQDYVNERIHDYLNQIFERSYHWIAKAAKHAMDGPIKDRHLLDKKMHLQHTFQDLSTNWPEIPYDHKCLQLLGHVSDIENDRKNVLSFYELIRNEAKLHYSDRILILAEMITFTHFMEWEDVTSDMQQLRKLLQLNVGENTLMHRFSLDTGFLTASQLEKAKKELTNTIHEGLLRIRNKLPQTLAALKRFNPYQPTFRKAQPFAEFVDKSTLLKKSSQDLNQKNVDLTNDYSRGHDSHAHGTGMSDEKGLKESSKQTEDIEMPTMRAEAISP